VAFAAFTAPLAWRRTGVASALPFVGVTAGLVVLAIFVLRSNRAALLISTAGLAAQILGVIGAGFELLNGVHGAKAHELQRLGIDPEFGVALNLAYSLVASAVFAWVAVRWREMRHR
jgi:hypothetical protein